MYLILGNFVLVTEEPLWQKAMFIYAIFFIFLSVFLCLTNVVWSIVRDPSEDKERQGERRNLLPDKNITITNTTMNRYGNF